jgi:hypothetical protein
LHAKPDEKDADDNTDHHPHPENDLDDHWGYHGPESQKVSHSQFLTSGKSWSGLAPGIIIIMRVREGQAGSSFMPGFLNFS